MILVKIALTLFLAGIYYGYLCAVVIAMHLWKKGKYARIAITVPAVALLYFAYLMWSV